MYSSSKWCRVAAVVLVMAATQTVSGFVGGSSKSADDAALKKLKAAGKGAAMTVVPTRLAGTAIPKVGETIALLLEQRGMTNLETSTAVFTPPENADLAATGRAFAEFVRAHPLTTEYALFADIMGSKETGITEVRAVIVDRQGAVAWSDKQSKGDADFDRYKPREPLPCCVLIADRLRPVLSLEEPKKHAPPGKIGQRWQKETGIPAQDELEQIQQRGLTLKKEAAKATLVIYPVHAGDDISAASAARISKQINEKKLTNAVAVDAGPRFAIARDINQQKVLWSLANNAREYVKKNPPNADYALFADYLMGKNAVGGVHIAICNKQGDLVVVDFQNNHWPDFKAVDPKTREDCDRLVIKRLQQLLK